MTSKIARRVRSLWSKFRCWAFLRRRVTGRLKLRGDTSRIQIDPSFRCDGDLWLGIHADEGVITIEAGVSASGPLVVTAVRPLVIGEGVLFGPNVLVTDHYHGDIRNADHLALAPSVRPLHSAGAIVIGRHVQFGANSVVLSPADIGSGAVIAANAVVKGNVQAGTVYVGLRAMGIQYDRSLDARAGE